MKLAIVTIGVSGSGKSTLAKHLIENNNTGTDFVEINRDDIRFNDIDPGGDWTTYEFSNENESRVTTLWNYKLQNSSYENKHVIISDTNVNIKTFKFVLQKLRKNKFDTICVFALNIPVDICIERDKLRGNFSVGEQVIRSQQEKMDNLLANRNKFSNIPFTYIVPKES